MKPIIEAQKTLNRYRPHKALLCNTRLWLGKGSGVVQAHGLRMRGHLGWVFFRTLPNLGYWVLVQELSLSYHNRDLLQ